MWLRSREAELGYEVQLPLRHRCSQPASGLHSRQLLLVVSASANPPAEAKPIFKPIS